MKSSLWYDEMDAQFPFNCALCCIVEFGCTFSRICALPPKLDGKRCKCRVKITITYWLTLLRSVCILRLFIVFIVPTSSIIGFPCMYAQGPAVAMVHTRVRPSVYIYTPHRCLDTSLLYPLPPTYASIYPDGRSRPCPCSTLFQHRRLNTPLVSCH